MAHRTPPAKPYPTFPLFAHARGYWAKKIDKRQLSFGRWEPTSDKARYEASWKAALANYNQYTEDVAHGRQLEQRPDEATLKLMCDAFLTRQHDRVVTGEIKPIHFGDVKAGILRFRAAMGEGLTLGELERDGVPLIAAWLAGLRADFGWYAYNRHVAIVRAMFKWSEHPVEGILRRPFRLMALLVKQGELQRRRESKAKVVERGQFCYTPAELWVMMHAGNIHHMAMMMLGYFCGFGNNDCGELTFEHVELDPDPSLELPPGWGHIHFPRPKTEIERAAVIPPLVCDVLRASIAVRPEPSKAKWSKRVFITSHGYPYTRQKIHRREDGVIEKVVGIDTVGLMHKRARERVGMCPKHGPMMCIRGLDGVCTECLQLEPSVRTLLQPARSLGFYTYRHTGITYASGTTTPDALALWEGHSIAGVRVRYVAHVEVPKLKPIADALLTRLLSRSRSAFVSGPSPETLAVAPSANAAA
jgi:hypothetical protein